MVNDDFFTMMGPDNPMNQGQTASDAGAALDSFDEQNKKLIEAQQKLLVWLYTDKSLRDRLRTSPEAVLAEFGLPITDAAAWLELLPDANQFAESLHIKRRTEASHHLPFSLMALERPRFDSLFLQFASTFQPTGHRKPLADAVAFGEWLLVRVGSEIPLAEWQRDVIEFEHVSRRIVFERRAFFIRRLAHAVHLWKPLSGQPPQRRRSLYYWWTWRGTSHWRVW